MVINLQSKIDWYQILSWQIFVDTQKLMTTMALNQNKYYEARPSIAKGGTDVQDDREQRTNFQLHSL